MKKVEAKREYGSDVMVDAIRELGLPYISLNPGASFRGLHDSLVNYGHNRPEMIECPHEKIAVNIAHGYAKASGRPMGVVLHDLVGLLQGTMGIYYAFHDRVPIVVFGGTGPMDTTKRRPNIDWYHTANVQGNAVRDYTKWDDQPAGLGAVATAIARGYRVAMAPPQGPVYIALDAAIQEESINGEVPELDWARLAVPSPIGPEPGALDRLARLLVDAHAPVLVAGYAGRDPAAFHLLVELAELLGAGVVDTNDRLNFPNRHPLNVTGSDAIEQADLIVFVDCKDVEKQITRTESATRRVESRIRSDATLASLGFNELGIAAWSHDLGALVEIDLEVTADTSVALPLLVERCRALDRDRPDKAAQRQERRDALRDVHDRTWQQWREQAGRVWDQSPVSTARLAAEVWEVVREHDWVLTAGTANQWALRTWDFDAPHRHPGRSLGTATQIGISLGVALAHRDQGRLVVDLQPDGDLMFDVGALWVASYYRLPLLVVMFNNRAYYNDWEHQEVIARQRGRPVENAYLGMEIGRPAPDFAAIARAYGWHGEGPIDDPAKVGDAVRRAADVALSQGLPALVDVVCQPQ